MAAPAPFNALTSSAACTAQSKPSSMIWRPPHGPRLASFSSPIQVDAYGANMPINQVASVTVPEARMLQISVWDRVW
jgi:hypothetical protein